MGVRGGIGRGCERRQVSRSGKVGILCVGGGEAIRDIFVGVFGL